MTPKIFSQTQEALIMSHTVQRSFSHMMHPHLTSPHPPTFVYRNHTQTRRKQLLFLAKTPFYQVCPA